ncbi:MAG: hypothetical protein MCM46_10230 [Candidatus Manganitrophus sp. SB1]|nr:hypothetical protein [Candidatus Manganitrophus morganii]
MNPARVTIPNEPISLHEATLPGVFCGLIGAASMAAVAMLFALFFQGDLWRPMKLAAATFLGEGAIGPGFQFGPVFLGLALHLTLSVALGVFFVWLGGYLSVGGAIAWGVIFSLSIWVIMQFGLLPVMNPWLAAAPPIPFALAHIAFGISLGIYPRFLKAAAEAPAVRRKAA